MLSYSPVGTPKTTPRSTPRRTPKIKTPSPVKRAILSESEDDNSSIVSGRLHYFRDFHTKKKKIQFRRVSRALTRSTHIHSGFRTNAHVAGKVPSSGLRTRLVFPYGKNSKRIDCEVSCLLAITFVIGHTKAVT